MTNHGKNDRKSPPMEWKSAKTQRRICRTNFPETTEKKSDRYPPPST